MILYALMYCMGVSLHLSQVYQNFQPYQNQECAVVYYVASKYDIYYDSKYKKKELEKLGFEYPLYMGPICMGDDNSLIAYHIPPEAVFQHNGLKWELEEIKEDGQFASPLPLLGESVGPPPKIPGAKNLMVSYRVEYDKTHPQYLEALQKYLKNDGFIIIREDHNASPDILWRPAFKYGTYNPYAPHKEQYEYYEGKNATDLVVRDW